jgi:hypothetical protein
MRTPFDINYEIPKSKDDRIVDLPSKLQHGEENVKKNNNNHKAFLEQAMQYDKKLKVCSFQVFDKVRMQNNRFAVGKSRKLSKIFLGSIKF